MRWAAVTQGHILHSTHAYKNHNALQKKYKTNITTQYEHSSNYDYTGFFLLNSFPLVLLLLFLCTPLSPFFSIFFLYSFLITSYNSKLFNRAVSTTEQNWNLNINSFSRPQHVIYFKNREQYTATGCSYRTRKWRRRHRIGAGRSARYWTVGPHWPAHIYFWIQRRLRVTLSLELEDRAQQKSGILSK